MVEHGRADALQPDDGYRVASFAGTLTIAAGAEETVVMVVGQTEDMDKARNIITHLPRPGSSAGSFGKNQTLVG